MPKKTAALDASSKAEAKAEKKDVEPNLDLETEKLAEPELSESVPEPTQEESGMIPMADESVNTLDEPLSEETE